MGPFDLHGHDLDPRAREVLREIVMQHIASGEAISSRTLAKCGRFDLSPASLRNVMADLEDLGYLQQPHTSAGRVPTDRGYRFFINHLMKSRALTPREREVIDDEVSARFRDRGRPPSGLQPSLAPQRSGRRRVHADPPPVRDPFDGLHQRRREQNPLRDRRRERRRREQGHRDPLLLHPRRAREDQPLHHRGVRPATPSTSCAAA